MSKKIVLINQSAGYLFVELANAFAAEYDEVVLLAGEVVPMNDPLDIKIKVHKIFAYNRQTTFKRFYSWVASLLNIIWLLAFKYRKYDLLVSSNPPTASTILPLLFRRKKSLLIYDIYPDGLIVGKFVSNKNPLFKAWAWLNRLAYKKVDKIITLTQGMATALEAYVAKEKIWVVPAWASASSPAENIHAEENLFIRKYNLQGKFIIMYSGNLGKEYELEPLVYLAEKCKENKNIVFIIMGKGWKKDILEKLIAEKNLHNCLLLPYQPSDLFVHSLAAFHIGVVSLAKSVDKVAIPSKTYNLLAASRPIFCIGNESSGLADFLNVNKIGCTMEPANIDAMKAFVEKVYTDKSYFDMLCNNAGKIATHYTKDRAKDIVALTR